MCCSNSASWSLPCNWQRISFQTWKDRSIIASGGIRSEAPPDAFFCSCSDFSFLLIQTIWIVQRCQQPKRTYSSGRRARIACHILCAELLSGYSCLRWLSKLKLNLCPTQVRTLCLRKSSFKTCQFPISTKSPMWKESKRGAGSAKENTGGLGCIMVPILPGGGFPTGYAATLSNRLPWLDDYRGRATPGLYLFLPFAGAQDCSRHNLHPELQALAVMVGAFPLLGRVREKSLRPAIQRPWAGQQR